MCTNVTIRSAVEGSAKGPRGWARIDTATVSFDHPYHAPFDHTLNIDFVDESAGAPQRVAVELSAASARALVADILAALAQGEAEAGLLEIGGRR
jgi:hypothetical protein